MSSRRAQLAFALFLLVLGIEWLAGSACSPRWPEDLESIVPARGSGVLVGNVPVVDGRSLAPPSLDLRLQLEAKLIRREETPRNLHRLALLRFARADLEGAIQLLHQATRLGRRAVTSSDLSALYLVRFDQQRDVRDLLRAHRESQHALEIEPQLTEARFNQAVALSLLRLERSAEAAWRAVDWQGAGPDWQAGVAVWLARIGEPTLEAQWPAQRQAVLDGQLAPEALSNVATVYPFRSTTLIEQELLPLWAGYVGNQDLRAADAVLETASILATTLASQRGDHLAADSILALHDSGPADGSSRVRSGLRAFDEGMLAFHRGDTAAAEPVLRQASLALAESGSPLYGWARFYAAVCRYYDVAAEAYLELSTLADEVSSDRYPGLAGRIQWMMGTIDVVQYRARQGLARFERSATLLERASGPSQASFVHVMQAETLATLGLDERSWYHWSQAIGSVPRFCIQRRWEAMWSALGLDLIRQGEAELAIPLYDEFVLLTADHPDPSATAQALIDRAEALARFDEHRAEREIDRARRAVERIAAGPLRRTLLQQLNVVEGWTLRHRNPHRALEALQEAERLEDERGYRFDALRVWTALGSVHGQLGNTQLARAWLTKTIERYERQRLQVANPRDRRGLLFRAQGAYDELLEVELAGQRSATEVFAVAERARARAQADEFGGDSRTESTNLEAVTKALGRDRALVYYTLTAQQVTAIVLDGDKPRLIVLQVTPERLWDIIESFRNGLQGHAPVSWLEVRSAALFDLLVRPLGLRPANNELVFIPDRFLQRLPFGALRDPSTGRYLVEDRPISVAPSATLWLRRRSAGATDQRRETVLAIAGAPASPRYPRLTPLRFVDQEVNRIARLYPSGRIVQAQTLDPTELVRQIASHPIVHFAGHAVIYPGDVEQSLLLTRSSLPKGRGFDDVGLRLERLRQYPPTGVELLVLAACSTSRSLGVEREAVYGLAGMIQALGVGQVISTLWNVDDQAAHRIALGVHRAYAAGANAPEALRLAIIESLEATPFADWAAFVVLSSATQKPLSPLPPMTEKEV